jgi:3-dehydroquinate dehydratase II
VRVAVLNGVNLDVVGRRNPDVYGGLTLGQLEAKIYLWAKEFGVSVECRQTNNEGEYVEWCHDALDWAGGLVLNPGAWTHYSYAIHDAVELFDVPIVEVHLSNIAEREEWRRTSVIAELAAERFIGKGPDGYRDALEYLSRSG